MSLTRAKKYPIYTLVHDKHRGALQPIFFLIGRLRAPWLPYQGGLVWVNDFSGF